MRISVTTVLTDRSWEVTEVARAVEERGLCGLWLPDHTHIPVSRTSPYPLGGELPERYLRNLEPVTALAMAAAVTTRIRLGTGVLLAAQRDPIVTAKALATLDHQSAGRVVVGVGYGWNIEEMRDHGVEPSTRRARTREHVLAMQRLWQDDVGTFAGRYVRVSPSWSWPKPQQHPLPVLIGGGATDTVFGQVVELGQGWIPLGARELEDALPRLHALAVAAGRDPEELEVIPFLGRRVERKQLNALERLGVSEVAIDVAPGDAAGMCDALDRIAELSDHRRGRSA